MNNNLQTILLKAKEDVYTHLQGGNLSHILGQGYDFAELREYDSSDDIRHISWINSAKLGQPYVKKMHEERELNVAVCTLLDGRFLMGEKLNILTHILAVLGYSSHEANDAFLSMVIHGSEVKLYPPTKDSEQIERSIGDIYTLKLLNTTVDYSQVESKILSRVEAKSLMFVIGDFLDPIDMAVLAQKHEVMVIMVRDVFEETPTPLADTQLINPQNSGVINQTLSKKAIQHYKSKLLEHDDNLMRHFHKHHIRTTKICHQDEIGEKLSQLFI